MSGFTRFVRLGFESCRASGGRGLWAQNSLQQLQQSFNDLNQRVRALQTAVQHRQAAQLRISLERERRALRRRVSSASISCRVQRGPLAACAEGCCPGIASQLATAVPLPVPAAPEPSVYVP